MELFSTRRFMRPVNEWSSDDQLRYKRFEGITGLSEGHREIVGISFRENCMRDAIRQHITTLVDTLPFNDSNIPDRIIDENIATPTESASLRKLRTTEDQVSGLISMLLTKDLTAMEKFLDIVADQIHADVVDKIRDMFKFLSEEQFRLVVPCVVCDLKQKCDIKLVYNLFYAQGQISAGLHRMIVYSELPMGSQDELWKCMFNELGDTLDSGVIHLLVEAMEHDGCCNTNLIKMLKRLLRKNQLLLCLC